MTKLITEHKDYWLLVDLENKPSKGDKFISLYEDESYLDIEESTVDDFPDWADSDYTDECHKIIAYLPKHKDAPVLEGVPLLPELPKQEEDVIKIANKVSENIHQEDTGKQFAWRVGFINGYKAASQKKWSDEERDHYALREQIKTLQMLANIQPKEVAEQTLRLKKQFEDTLQSLSSATLPIGFEPEYIHVPISPNGNIIATNKPYPFEGLISNFTIKSSLKIVNGVVQGRWIWQ